MVCLFGGEKRVHVSREKGPFWDTIVVAGVAIWAQVQQIAVAVQIRKRK